MSRRVGLSVFSTWILRSKINSNSSIRFSTYASCGSAVVLTKLVGEAVKGQGWKWQPLCTGEQSSSVMTMKRTLRNLQNVLLIDQNKATRVLKKYPAFKGASMTKITNTIDFLADHKVGTQRLRNNPWLLLMSPDDIENNTKTAMSILKVDFPIAVAFSHLSKNVLVKIAAIWKSKSEKIPPVSVGPYAPQPKNRLEYLACRLECSVEDIADMMGKVTNIAMFPICRLDDVLKLLLEADISRDAIISDPWTFDNQLGRMEERINICRRQGFIAIKPWILRAPVWKFESHVNRTVTEHNLLKGHSDIGSFLQHKLGCTESKAKEIQLRVPSIKTASAAKLNEMIDFLYSKGFTTDHILESPRVLGHSVCTISKRLEDFSAIDCVPDSLLVLCRTSKGYNSLMKQIARTRDKSKQTIVE